MSSAVLTLALRLLWLKYLENAAGATVARRHSVAFDFAWMWEPGCEKTCASPIGGRKTLAAAA